MKKGRIFGLLAILVILSSSTTNMWSASAVSDYVIKEQVGLTEGISKSILIPSIINSTQYNSYEYHNDLKSDRKYRWKVKNLERTDNFHIAEGDKHLKDGDTIILSIGGDPSLQLDQPHVWGLVYVNDVMARYSNDAEHGRSIFKFIQPSYYDYYENFTDPAYNETTFLDWYESKYNWTDFSVTHFNQTFYYNETGYFSYIENSPYVNKTRWTVYDDVVVYWDKVITGTGNVTEYELTYDKETGFLNELHFTAQYINGTGHFAGANLSYIRLHGWGLPYTITTWVVWIPILLITVGLIVAIRMRAFQKFRLYLEARKLAQRE